MNEQIDVNVEKLQPFTKILMTIGQLPTSYLMSMSYYEQLIWFTKYLQETVIPTINNNASAVEEVQQIVIDLQTYINNYFDNLDVQQEINNKLDKMAQDGTLYNIIKTYTDPIINEQNQRITSVENELQSVASGSPLVASSTSGMTDTTRTYVNTSNGYWYYYNGTTWVQGGLYQSELIGKNAVTMYNLDGYINNSVDGFYSNITVTYEDGKYINSAGVESSGSADVYAIYKADLQGGERLQLRTTLRGQDYSTVADTVIYQLLDEDNTVIENYETLLHSNLNDIILDISVPENCKKIKINCNHNKVLYLISSTQYKQKVKVSYDDLDSTLKTKFSLSYNTQLSPTSFVSNAYIALSGTNAISLVGVSGYNVIKFDLQPNKHYLLKNLIGFYGNISYGIGSNIEIPLTLSDVTYNTKLIGDYYKSDVSGADQLLPDKYIIAPPFATTLYVNTSSLNQSSIAVYEANSIATEIDYNIKDILYGKKYVACGDSFTHGDFTGYTGDESDVYDSTLQMYKTYPYWIGQRNNMTVINEGINGSIMALDKTYVDDPTGVSINTRYPFSYQRYQEIPSDADYITIMFGLNDMYNTYLGTINDTTNTSFYGAGNVVLQWLITNRPDAKIGIIISNAYLSNNYRQALKELSAKWGVGYLDLYNDTSISKTLNGNGMSETAQAIRNAQYYVTENNHHPNVKAHIIMSHAIEDFLRKL